MHTIIFDFDGTIADTMSVVIRIANKFADHYGYKKIPLSDLPKLREKKPSMGELRRKGYMGNAMELVMDFSERQRLVHKDEFDALERKYVTKD